MLTVTKKYDLPYTRARFELDADLSALVLRWCATRGCVWAAGDGHPRITRAGRVTVTADRHADWGDILAAFGGLTAADEHPFRRVFDIRAIRLHYAPDAT